MDLEGACLELSKSGALGRKVQRLRMIPWLRMTPTSGVRSHLELPLFTYLTVDTNYPAEYQLGCWPELFKLTSVWSRLPNSMAVSVILNRAGNSKDMSPKAKKSLTFCISYCYSEIFEARCFWRKEVCWANSFGSWKFKIICLVSSEGPNGYITTR